MKRMKRILAVVLASALCLCLTGCQALKDMRAAHAVWQEDDSIYYNGNVYKPLASTSEDLNMYGGECKEIYVTKSDVPVLLSPMIGSSCDISENEVFIFGYHLIPPSGISLLDPNEVSEVIYCRADHFDAVSRRLEEGFEAAKYSYEYYDWDRDKDKSIHYTLTAQEKQAVDTVLATEIPDKMLEDMYFDYDYIIELYGCSEDDLFCRHLMSIQMFDDNYYIMVGDLYYVVPDQYAADFAGIFKAEIAADSYWEEY